MGNPWTFRGDFGDLSEDNRVNAAINPAGDKVFITWLDTQVPGVTDNINPDVFARGFDLMTNKITAAPVNVTFLSDVTQQAYFECTSFTYVPADYTIQLTGCEFPVAVNDRQASASVSVYPNPATDVTEVKLNLVNAGNVRISVTNMLGQQVLSVDKGFINSGSHQFTLNVSNLSTGVYFCTVQVNGEKYTQKLVVK